MSVRIAIVCFVLSCRKKIVPRAARIASLIWLENTPIINNEVINTHALMPADTLS
jgi:hypothetical protein